MLSNPSKKGGNIMKKGKTKRGAASWQGLTIVVILLVSVMLAMITAPLMAYQVTRGDTLWNISGKFLKNPFMWPKVWAINPYILNPHWIYPGNKIILKVPEPAMPAKQVPKAVEVRQPKPVVKPKPAPPVLTHENIHAEGFIAESRLKEIGRVLTNEDDTPLDSEPKILCFYAREGETILPGDRYTTFKYVKTVKHPIETYKKLGYLIQLGGDIEVFRVKGRFCFAKILHNYEEIGEGDPIGNFRSWPDKLVLTPFKKPLKAYIVMMKDGLMMGAQDKVVYIDKGSADGLRPGNELTIYKNCPSKYDPYRTCCRAKVRIDTIDRKVGTLVVLSTQSHSATAMVYTNRMEIEVGDRVGP